MNSKTNFNKNWISDTNGKTIHVDKPRRLLGKQLETYKKQLTLNHGQKQVLVGLLLGDAYVNFHRESKNPTFYIEFAQSVSRANYVDHVYQILKPFVGSPPKINLIGGIKPDKLKRYEVRFKTYSHPEFQFYYHLFYPLCDGKRVKRVPKNIADLLTPKGLAYWYIDDGSTSSARGFKSCVFNCQGFDRIGLEILAQAMQSTFNFHTSVYVDKTFYKLYVRAQSVKKFLNLIKPFMHPDFYYKL